MKLPPDPKSKEACRITRRRFMRIALYGIPAVVVADAALVEPNWIRLRKLRLTDGKPSHRILHFTDLHHKGDRKFLQSAVNLINAQSPDLVCFTGDIIEDTQFLPEALELFQQIKSPLYGIPGNHDYWAHADFTVIAEAFAKTGGRWLMDESVSAAGDKINIAGATCSRPPQLALSAKQKNIVLIHYPEWVDKLGGYKFDLALAGHSHGGQVRLPFYGPLVVPFGVGRYDLGRFETASGPLYVGAGLGWFYLNFRFNCRPEITVIEI
jgi:predicted MPP superfamily phosphohydrolase